MIVLAFVGLGGAAAYTAQQTPVYSASTQLFVSVRTDPGIAELTQGSTFTQQRVKSYVDLVTSPRIAEPVIAQLALPFTPDGLASMISASSPLDTVLLNIEVSDTDPTRAAAIANAVGEQFPKLVAELEPPTDQNVSPVQVSVTRKATIPGAPVSPRVPLNLTLGLFVGIALGIGLAVLRDQMNTTVSGVDEIEKLTGAIPLGVVPFDPTTSKQPLVTSDSFGGRAEAFRTLRTNLQFADVDDPPRVITITSALPAEGKTTTACNIALTLAQSGARVILVEGDLRKPAAGKYLGISNAAGLTNVLAGQHELRDVIVSYQRESLAVLPSGPTPPNPSEMLGSQQMSQLLATLAADYDMVIIDAPPLLPVTDGAVLAAASDGAILVIRNGKSRREEVERATQALASVNAKVIGSVLNFAPRKKKRGGYDGYGYGYGYGAAPALAPELESKGRTSKRRRKETAPVAARPASLPLGGMPVGAPQQPALVQQPSPFPVREPSRFPVQQPSAFPVQEPSPLPVQHTSSNGHPRPPSAPEPAFSPARHHTGGSLPLPPLNPDPGSPILLPTAAIGPARDLSDMETTAERQPLRWTDEGSRLLDVTDASGTVDAEVAHQNGKGIPRHYRSKR